MSEATLFEFPYGVFLKQRLEFVVICNDHLEASIMRVIEREMIRMKETWQAKVEQATEAKKTPPREPRDYWVRLSQSQIIARLYMYDSEKIKKPETEDKDSQEWKEYQWKKALSISRSTLVKKINGLLDKGFLLRRSKPGDEFGSSLYTLHRTNIQKAMESLPSDSFSLFFLGGVSIFESGGVVNSTTGGESQNLQVGVSNSQTPSLKFSDSQSQNVRVDIDSSEDSFSDSFSEEREGAAHADATPAQSEPGWYRGIPLTYSQALAYLAPHGGVPEGYDAVQVMVLARKLWVEERSASDTASHSDVTAVSDSHNGLQESDEDEEATVKMPAIRLAKGGTSDVHSDVDSHPVVRAGGDAGAGSGVPDLSGNRRASTDAGIPAAHASAGAGASVETALSEIIPSSPSHTGGAARNRDPQGDESRAPDADTFPALSQDAGQAVGEGNGAVQASGEPVLSRSGERPKRARKPPIEQPAGPPQEPPADMAWGTRKCLLLFDYWRGAHLIGKWKLQKASECALGLAKQYSQDYVTAAKEVMDADSYWSDQGGVDICSMANNIHKYRRKIERKLGVQRNAAVLDFSKAVCIDTQFRVYQVPGDDREWILWEGEYLSPEEADKRGYNGGFGLYNVTEYDFVPNGIGRGVS